MSFDGYMQIVFSTIVPAIITIMVEIILNNQNRKKKHISVIIGIWFLIFIIVTLIYYLTKQDNYEISNNESIMEDEIINTGDWYPALIEDNNVSEKNNYNIEKSDIASTQASKIEENDNQEVTDEGIEEQPYQDNYIIPWEDNLLEKLLNEALNEEYITYKDIKNIKSLYIFEDKIVIDSEPKYIYVETLEENMADNISLNDLKYFSSLCVLGIYNYKNVNFNIFNDKTCFQNLQSIYIRSKINEDQFDDIICLNQLTSLYIFNNNINTQNLEKISTMKNIKYLEISWCNITDISCIGDMTQLEYLDISMNNISNIKTLKNLHNLKKIILYDNKIHDFTPISHVDDVIYEEQ